MLRARVQHAGQPSTAQTRTAAALAWGHCVRQCTQLSSHADLIDQGVGKSATVKHLPATTRQEHTPHLPLK